MMEQAFEPKEQIQNEISSFLKRTKLRQEEHHRLCDHINKVLMRKAQLQQNLFIHDEIIKQQNKLEESQLYQIKHSEVDEKVAVDCDQCLDQQEQKILGRRIMARVLQVAYAAIEAFREHRQYYSLNYFRFKDRCLKIVNQGTCIPSVAIRLGSKYLGHKMDIQHKRLKQLIKCMEVTNFQVFSHLKSTYYQLLMRKEGSNTIRKQISLPTQRNQTPILLAYKSRWKEEETIIHQKDSKTFIRVRTKAKSIKQDVKIKNKQKKAEAKKIKKYVSCINQVMDICKEDLLDDLAPSNKEWEARRLLGGLVTRNKNNQSQITIFLERQPYFEEKTSQPILRVSYESNRCHSLERQLIEKDEDDSVQIIHNSFTTKNIRIDDTNKKQPVTIRRRQSMRIAPFSGSSKIVRPNQRATINNIEQISQKNERKKEKIAYSEHKQLNQGEHMIEVNLKGALKLSKARFPQIPTTTRAASVSKKSIQKQQEQPSPLKSKQQIKQNGNFFEEIEKRIIKFCQLKKNLAI